MFQHSHRDGPADSSVKLDSRCFLSRVLPCPPPHLPSTGRVPRARGRAGTGTQRSERVPEPGLLSWRWLAALHPRGQLVSVGGGFHGGSPEGLQPGFGRGRGPAGPFFFVLDTLGLCPRLARQAFCANRTRITGGVWTWVRTTLPRGQLLNLPWEGAEQGISPTSGPSIHLGIPLPTGATCP